MDGDDGDDSEETNEENELPVQYSRKNPSSSFSALISATVISDVGKSKTSTVVSVEAVHPFKSVTVTV